MLGEDQFFQSRQMRARGFEEHEDFRGGFEFFAPQVMGFEARNQIGAGDEARGQCGFGQLAGGFQVRRGDEHEGEFGGGFHV